jgi:putative ABC transport system permease protein
MGATVKSIVILLSKEFLLLVGMAFILSVPFAYYISDQWLQAFAFRIDLGLWIFASAGLLSMIIAFLTISVRTAGAAKLDPVKTLRYE